MRLVAIAVLVLLMLTGCGGDSDPAPTADAPPTVRVEPTPISPPVASPSPYPTPIAALTPIVSSGWAVAMFADGLFAVGIDRTNLAPSGPYGERITLTTGPVTGPRGATYAGSFLKAGEMWVYAVQIPLPDVPNPDATLVRTSLIDGHQEELLSFKTTMVSRDGVLSDPSAAVSPDGRYIAYTDVDGLRLFDVSTGTRQLLAMDSCPTGVDIEKCNTYTAPIWSSDGSRLLVTKQLYEGSHLVFVDLTGIPSVADYADVPGDYKAWSFNGAYFCALNDAFVPGGLFVARDPGQAMDIAASVPGIAQACGWSTSGQLAVAYSVDVMARPDEGLTLPRTMISIRDETSPEVTLKDLNVPIPQTRLVSWIPSGEGLLLHTTPSCEPDPCPNTTISGVLGLDGSYQGFVFNPAAVLAIIPAP